MRTAAAATALGITLSIAALSSCSSDPVEMPVPSPSVTPVFASEAEALAAAEALYTEYVAYANALGQSGWLDPSGFEKYVSGVALKDELKTSKTFRGSGWRQVGDATFDRMQLQQVEDAGKRNVVITVYVCSDVTAVDVIDANGQSVIARDRPPRQPLEVEMNDANGGLRIERREPWSGADFC